MKKEEVIAMLQYNLDTFWPNSQDIIIEDIQDWLLDEFFEKEESEIEE